MTSTSVPSNTSTSVQAAISSAITSLAPTAAAGPSSSYSSQVGPPARAVLTFENLRTIIREEMRASTSAAALTPAVTPVAASVHISA